MGRVAMSCNDVRQGLPLLPGADPEHTARIRAHALACEACGELVRAYEADDRQLSAVKSDRRVPDGVLDGFTASVMARIADEQRKRVAAPAHVAPSQQAVPVGGVVLRPDFGAWRLVAAVAAALVVAVGIDLSGGLGGGASGPAPLANAVDATVAPGEGPGVVAPLPVFTSNPTSTPAEALPAPARLERDPAPMPLRRRGPIVPVDQGGRRGAGRGGAGQQDLMNLIDEVLPNLHQRMLRQFGDEKEGREVRF